MATPKCTRRRNLPCPPSRRLLAASNLKLGTEAFPRAHLRSLGAEHESAGNRPCARGQESYWGHVNPIGPRACYDEGKRVAETMMYAYQQQVSALSGLPPATNCLGCARPICWAGRHKQGGVDVRVARIFNTFGPRMNPADGRVVSNFIVQALQGQDLSVYVDGLATRSFQYVDDLVAGLMALMESDYSQPVNIGNPDEYTIKRFAELIIGLTHSNSSIAHLPPTQDDPKQRRPDIS